MQASADLEAEISQLSITSPYVIVTNNDNDNKQYFVVVENAIFLESTDFTEALLDLLSVFFCFNIEYPKQLYPILIFLQHHVCNIKDQQVVPNVVKVIYSAMSN